MDLHKSMYKEQRTHTPRQHSRMNRKLQEDNRAKHRKDRYQNSRNIFLSPDRQLKELMPLDPGNKENLSDKSVRQCQDTTLLAKIICNATNPEKLTKQEAFVKRFLEWKAAKNNVKKPEKMKPFATSAMNECKATTSTSLVPNGHHKGFRPPDGLKNSKEEEKVEENKKPVMGRQSIYTLVPTPPKKQNNEKPTKKFAVAKKNALPAKKHTNILILNKTKNGSETLAKSASKSTISNNLRGKTPGDLKKTHLRKSPSVSTAKNIVAKVARTLEKSQSKTTPAHLPVDKKDLRPRCLKMPPPPAVKSVPTVKKLPQGAIAKIRSLAEKSVENVKAKRKSPFKSARLAQNLKAKKPLNKKKDLPALKLNGKQIVSIIKGNEPTQTPRDFSISNPFSEFVTSTKVKDTSENIKICGISPIKSSPQNLRSNTSAKRNILGKDYDLNAENPSKKCSPQNGKRYKFLRYSGADILTEGGVRRQEDEKSVVWNEDEKTIVNQPVIVDTTPTRAGPEERPSNYLSPFVSVTRGKVSLKKEKEKRNSIYLQNATESNDLPSENNQNSPQYSVEMRRTLEAVRYFRKQLQDEIDRLHQLCDIWEAYKNENLEKIQNANGEDMINVTIGQTRLLTSKKLMQFKGLIDRCEARATGIGDVECDGSEDTKTITTVDLEGFWSMLGLQVDNLDKRFENLNRWKANDWLDPEEVKPKKKTNLTKVKKPKAAPVSKSKPNSALQQMLRKMQAEMKKNKDKNEGINEIVVLTSSKQKQSTSSNNSTPRKSLDTSASRRLSVTVKDRKFFSPAATVLSFSPNRRVSLRRKPSLESPKLNKNSQNFNDNLVNMQLSRGLRKSVLLNENSRRMSLNPKSPSEKFDNKNSQDSADVINKSIDFLTEENNKQTFIEKCPSPKSPIGTSAPNGRKSILKTPGTAKSKLRNVIFNEKLRVKKFNFLINDNFENGEEGDDTLEEDLAICEDESAQRTYSLRNRKIRLRPSCEIVIPKN